MKIGLMASLSLSRREWVRFLRQRHRVVGALLTPLVFWLLLGGGLGHSFSAPGISGNYLDYFFPGTVLMILLFTAVFSTISVIEDRREGFLQAAMVSAAPRASLVLGKLLGGTMLAVGQGMLFLLIGPMIGIRLDPIGLIAAFLMMVLISFALCAMGFCLAWRLNSTQGFHALMNLLLMPMWMLSGALFPASGALGPVRWIMAANPLTYSLAALRKTIRWDEMPQPVGLDSLGLGVAVSVLFAGLMVALALRMARAGTVLETA
jgi:ABC-2 type transport system permease protein